MLLIFLFSNQPGSKSSNLSDSIIIKTMRLVTGENISPEKQEQVLKKYVFVVRKSGHIFIYFILAILVFLLLKEYFLINKKLIIYTILFCLCYAISDEFHQLFIPDRSGEFKDVLIDTTSSTISTMLIYYITKSNNRRGRKKKMLFIEYPKCSTCQKAKVYLENHNFDFTSRNIVSNTPTYEELKKYLEISNLDIKKFFNTSGLKYKELNLKEKLASMSDDDKLKLLSTDGMLIKRPLLILENNVLVGFNEEKWNEIFKEEK